MDIEKIRSTMNGSLHAAGEGNLKLDAVLCDVEEGWGRNFRLREGLEAGARHLHDEFVGTQRDLVRKVYGRLGAPMPLSWKKSEICTDMLSLLARAHPVIDESIVK